MYLRRILFIRDNEFCVVFGLINNARIWRAAIDLHIVYEALKKEIT